ncbi:hypothetical protein DXA97_00725 [Clostridium sp. OF09-36]|nr:hypothetical protein DXA97_00725 [Clostridium sp. OF09-36]
MDRHIAAAVASAMIFLIVTTLLFFYVLPQSTVRFAISAADPAAPDSESPMAILRRAVLIQIITQEKTGFNTKLLRVKVLNHNS